MRWLKNIIKITISLLLISVLIYYSNPLKVYNTVKDMNICWVLVSLILLISTIVIFTMRIRVLVSALDKKVTFNKMLNYTTLAWAFGLFSPAKIGELYMVKPLKDEGLKIGESTAIFIIDKFTAILTHFIFSFIGLFYFAVFVQNIFIIILLSGIIIALGFVVLSKRGIGLIKKFFFKSITQKFEGFSKTFSYLKKEKKIYLMYNLILNILSLVLRSLVVFVLFISIGKYASIPLIAAITAITTLAALVPISLSGLGIRESFSVFLFGVRGYDVSTVTGIYLISSLIMYALAALLMPFLIRWSKISSKNNPRN
ncbi:MAG: flippase-like domain-containing protein [Nanoarchaeota archaeon]|nr:flippase-like domain-containing protein [Nanoarchaeota archaeon]MBU1005581.1 flippase-like domain-containing protein [Nanoarchaeota archaeon]MBU1945967.1 flippase-like domain-containing protein [Nanoarchaeota archaeon]